MCSHFIHMENYQGDLADVVRASSGVISSTDEIHVNDWEFPIEPTSFSSMIEEPIEDFGDPFTSMRDPLLHELDIVGSGFYNSLNSSDPTKPSAEGAGCFGGIGGCGGGGGGGGSTGGGNIFSRMLQISPNGKLPVSPLDSPMLLARGIKTNSSLICGDHMIKANSSKGCLMDNSGMQISSSSRNPGIKRRKSQAKKVVCIPAPAASNSRPSGEVVPSDLWAWRKYGQKPIKGSPYPRGYYRCSSSKGCSARKQVERSRTDPNMLVITYTSEHNHPWPTQRNALAGSTRSQPVKNNGASKNHLSTNMQSTTTLKEEPKESNNNEDGASSSLVASTSASVIKEEMGEIEKEIDMDDAHEFNDQGLPDQSYKPTMPDSNQSHEDFFSELGELESDPLNLLLLTGDGERENKALDPFSLFDWTENNNRFGEANRGL